MAVAASSVIAASVVASKLPCRAMTLRRLPPLAIALALVAAALVATVIATRHSVNDAFATVGDGQAIAEELDVRADLSDLDGPPTSAQLDALLA